jgi:hypothetical protein
MTIDIKPSQGKWWVIAHLPSGRLTIALTPKLKLWPSLLTFTVVKLFP